LGEGMKINAQIHYYLSRCSVSGGGL